MAINTTSTVTSANITLLFLSTSPRKPTRWPPPVHHRLILPLRPSSSQFCLHIPKSTALWHSPPLPLLTSTANIRSTEFQEYSTVQNSKIYQQPPINRSQEDDTTFNHILLDVAAHNWDLQVGRAIHAGIIKTQVGEEGDVVLFNKLIAMYVRHGRVSDARKLFENMSTPDVVSYTTMISAFSKSRKEEEAVEFFSRMRRSGVEFNDFTLVAILTSCIRCLNRQLGLQIHALAIKSSFCVDVYVSNALISLYVKLGQVDDAVRLFGGSSERDVSSWNAVISGMVMELRYDQAFALFDEMRMDGFSGDQFTLSSLLTAAEEGLYWTEGETIHSYGIKIGLEQDLSFGNALMTFYTKLGCVEDVVAVFKGLPTRDVISWTAMVSGFMEFGQVESAIEVFNQMNEITSVSYNALMAGFCKNEKGIQALELFQKVVEDGMELSDFTIGSAIRACALVSDAEKCRQVHGFVVKVGYEANARIESTLLDMYSKCNRMKDAEKIFKKGLEKENLLIASTSLICGYARNEYFTEALYFFNALVKQEKMVSLDEVLLTTVLGVCGALGFIELGKQIHSYTFKLRNSFDVTLKNALLGMYSKCGDMDDALKVFRLMPEYDIVSWNTLITAHLLHHQGDEALVVWKQMLMNNIKPDHISFLLIFLACKFTRSDPIDFCAGLFSSMTISYGIQPCEQHYAAIVGVLGHWNYFDKAEDIITDMPHEPGALIWRTLLDNCRTPSSLSLRKQATQEILELRPLDPSTYILISNLYSASGRWHCSEKLREEMRQKGLRKHPSQSWVIHQYKIHCFYSRDKLHPQSKDIYGALDILILESMKAGYIPDTSFVLQEVEEFQKKEFLFYHSAKLAATYGHLITTAGRPVRVMKNIQLCGDCHSFLRFMSLITAREIILRDTTGFHCFKGGKCSCRDQRKIQRNQEKPSNDFIIDSGLTFTRGFKLFNLSGLIHGSV